MIAKESTCPFCFSPLQWKELFCSEGCKKAFLAMSNEEKAKWIKDLDKR